MQTNPVHNIDLERSLLGSVVLSRRAYEQVADRIDAADFHVPSHSQIWLAISSIYAQGLEPTLPLVMDRAGQDVAPQAAATFADRVAPSNARHYADRVGALSRTRSAQNACIRYLEGVAKGDEAQRLFGDLTAALSDADARGMTDETAEEVIRGAVAVIYNQVEAAQERDALPGITTGYAAMDRLMGGFKPGLHVVCGYSSAGKSAALVPTLMASARRKCRWRLYCVDMPPYAWLLRFLQHAKKVHRRVVMRRALTPEHLQTVTKIANWLEEAGCAMVRSKRTLRGIVADASRYMGTYDMLIVDTANSLLWNDRRTMYDRTNDLVLQLKALAIEADVPVIATMQANDPPRKGDVYGDKPVLPPSLNEVEGSRRITHEAAGILVVHRDSYGKAINSDDHVRGQLIWAKDQRDGCTGSVSVQWNPAIGRFEEE